MKITLSTLNSKFIHSNPAIHSLKAFAKKYSADNNIDFPEISIKEFSINDLGENVMFSLCSDKPDIIGFSVYIWNSEQIQKLCSKIKTVLPDTIVIIGGPQVSYGLEMTSFRNDDYDYLVKGEGERAFFSLVSKICNNGFIPDEKWKFEINNKICQCANAEKLDEFPFIYNENNLDDFSNKIIYYESSRGCPFRCAYCLSSVCGKVRGLPMDRVKSDLKFFLTHNVRQVKFVDRTFNYDIKRAKEIWKFLIENASSNYTNFHFEISADIIDDESIEILSSAPTGLFRIEAGIQSFNEKTLSAIGRKCNNEKLTENLKEILANRNMVLHDDLIAGLPFEDLNSFKDSFNNAYSIGAHQLQLGFLKLLPGAPLNDMIEENEYKFSKNPPYEILQNKYLSYFDILILKKVEDVLERFFNSGRFKSSIKFLEKYFENPFEMFEKIAEVFEKNNLLFQSVSSKNLYCFLHSFFKENVSENSEEFDKLLLLDYYLTDRSEQIPVDLKYLTAHQRRLKNELHESGIKEDKNHTIRIIEDEIYIFDYTEKNPVTEEYRYGKL